MNDMSPAPGVPQTPHKAVWTTIGSFVGLCLTFWIADTDPFTAKDAGEMVLTAGIGSGVLGLGTYKIKNRRR